MTPNSSTHIAADKIIGKSKDGKAISGFCNDSDTLLVKTDGGMSVLTQE